jgi:hypothetical protein
VTNVTAPFNPEPGVPHQHAHHHEADHHHGG